MSKQETTKSRRTRRHTKPFLYRIVFVCFFVYFVSSLFLLSAAENARQIVDEAQKRTDAKSERYEGLLQVFDAKGKISDKRWTFDRIGSHGNSKRVLRFSTPDRKSTRLNSSHVSESRM